MVRSRLSCKFQDDLIGNVTEQINATPDAKSAGELVQLVVENLHSISMCHSSRPRIDDNDHSEGVRSIKFSTESNKQITALALKISSVNTNKDLTHYL